MNEDESSQPNSFGLDRSKLTKLKDLAARKGQASEANLRSMDTVPLPTLEPQQYVDNEGNAITTFGQIKENDASVLAAISKATGVDIYIVGSSVSNQDRLASARHRHGDTVKTADGGDLPRPVGDIDFLIDPHMSKDSYDMAKAMIQKNMIDERGESEIRNADYMLISSKEDIKQDVPRLTFSGGKVVDYSSGSDGYYTLQGGGVKQVQRL